MQGADFRLIDGRTQRPAIHGLCSRITQEAEVLYAEVEAENAGIANERPVLSATMAGEPRCRRTILHTVVKEMAKQTA